MLLLFCMCCLPLLGCSRATASATSIETRTAAATNNSDSNIHVPLFLRNISLSAKEVPAENPPTVLTANTVQKVPLQRNTTEQAAPAVGNSLPQTPASVFFASYNNQQNVLQLVRNVDTRLRSIRNVEMRVATIQEIFDSLHFSSSVPTLTSGYKNSTDMQQQNVATAVLTQDLQLYSKRLSKKLQKASHVVLKLRDFFRFNITKFLLYPGHTHADYSEDDEDEVAEVDFDTEIDELDADSTKDKSPDSVYLRTCIETFEDGSGVARATQNYNKQQIQIVNYLQTDSINRQQQTKGSLYDRRALQANSYIVEKLHYLKSTLTRADAVYEPVENKLHTANSNNVKLKLVGNHFKHIYFLSRSDDASDPNARYTNDLHFRHLYVSAIQSKYVLLLIDIGAAMNAELLELTKTFVSNTLQLLSNTDLISIVTIAAEANDMLLDSYASDTIAASTGIYLASRERQAEIINYVHSLSLSKATTNHTLGFAHAFQLLQRLRNASFINTEQPVQFVYLTRGLLANLSDAMQVLNVIAREQQGLEQPIVINTCAVVLDEKRIMYERQFLSDIATQNYSKYDIKFGDWLQANVTPKSLVGKFFVLTKNQPDILLQASTAIFSQSFDATYLTDSLEVHLPVVDANSRDAIVSITHSVAPYGVVGVNLYMADLLEDIANYQQQDAAAAVTNKHDFTYAFLIDRNGVAITHPAFPRAITQTQTPYPVDISYLENSTDFAAIRRRMLHDETGNASTTVYLKTNRKIELLDRTYYWQPILGIYVLCLVSTNKREMSHVSTNAANVIKAASLQLSTSMPMTMQRYAAKDNLPPFQHTHYEYLPTLDLLYHRLDLLPTLSAPICRYFHQVATLDAATLFLSSAAFESPFTFLHSNRLNSQHAQLRTVESIMAYLKDATGLIANPGLRPHIRHEVNALYNAMQQLKKRHQDARGTLKNYIIRRYISTVNGVLQVYPGCLLSGSYDPTQRPWFRKAMQQPGKIVTTAPYLDAGGAGYIVTLAHTIYEGKANALHSVERDRPVAIVALDLPYAYYYRMLLDTTPLCQLHNIKCLLFEDEGYLIAHPSALEVSNAARNQRRPHEHLTHKESYLANDILNHKTLVRKLACANYQNRTLQRYYVFNTSLSDILTNVVHGERTKYAIALVRGSNIFAAVLNSSCDGGAFCPCSTIDRICLNCKRMDQADCECPCECPMEIEVYDDPAVGDGVAQEKHALFSNYTKQYAYCEPPTEHFLALLAPTNDALDVTLLHACVNINCDIYGSQSECLGVMGCEWCQQDLDGNGFAAAFCTAQAACFNGVLSSLTPYGDLADVDMIVAHGYNPGQKQNSYSAFGPVGGAIVVLGIVIGFAIYCYRHNLDAHTQDQFYIDSTQEENYGLPLSRFNFDDCQAHDEPPGGAGSGAYDHAAAQRNLMHPADISPYHMSTGSSYRRPPNGESDHGYSTMTPHEDSSDHQCFTLAEPLLLNDKRNSKSDTLSISTSISSPTNRHHHHHHAAQHSAQNAMKDARYNNLTSPKKLQQSTPSPARYYEQTMLPAHDDAHEEISGTRYILAPVTVHRHMETSES